MGVANNPSTARPTKRRSRQEQETETAMNGLIKQSKLDGVNFFGSLTIALSSVAVVLYAMANGFGGGLV
jgi:hypothetical protein